MEPKFQSSFIPKGPSASSSSQSFTPTPTTTGIPSGRRKEESNFLYFIGVVIFIISLVLAIGVFGYKFYIKYRIEKMGTDLEAARTALELDTVKELTLLNSRIISTTNLIKNHHVLNPLFEFPEGSTPKVVRFTNFLYNMNDSGLQLSMKGQARGYSALALEAQLLNKSIYFKNILFSDLSLNDKGEVNFSITANIDPQLLSYERSISNIVAIPTSSQTSTSTTTATSTPR